MFLKTVKAEQWTTRATDGYHSTEPRAQPTVRRFLKTVKAEHLTTRAIGGYHSMEHTAQPPAKDLDSSAG